MTTDEQITDDLAIVARTSRARPIALEATLARVTAGDHRPAAPVGFVTTYIYATRIARASGGIAAVLSIAALMVYIQFGHGDDTGMLDVLAHMPKFWVALCVLSVVSVTHVVAARIAISAKQPDRHRAGIWSVAASIAGVMSFSLFFGMTLLMLGSDSLLSMADHWRIGTHVMLISAIGSTVVGAIVIARTGITRKSWMLPSGILVLVATLSVGFAVDVGPMPSVPASVPLRAVLTATGTVALFLIVTSLVLRVHERDEHLSPG